MRQRRISSILTALAVTVGLGVATAPADASTDGTGVVISEVYGAGGNAGAAYNKDYIELYNPTDAPVNLAGWSVQYRSATGTANPSGVTALTGSIPAKGYYLIAEAGGAVGADIPTAQVTGNFNMSGTTGTVFLAKQATALTAPATGSLVNNPNVADLVGFGTSNTFEGTVAPAPSATNSIARDAAGKDTDVNAADFSAAAGTPGTAPAGGGPIDPPTGDVVPIADIQGNTDVSPKAGQTVTTEGVVTAAYPTGGFNGFYLQTPGTGGDLDPATHTRSDAIFVFGSSVAGSVRIGDHVRVTGAVSEYQGLTEITPSGGVQVLTTPAEAVKPANVTLWRTPEQRESLEGMLIAPQGPFTVTNNYNLNNYSEIGLAAGDKPLWTPTEIADPNDAAAIAGVQAENAAKRVTLDDGASINYLGAVANKNLPLPYLTQDPQIRVGAQVTFTQPIVFDYRNNTWKYQPTGQLTGTGTPPATFTHTRQAAPTATPGNVHIASFNVLNYFATTGAAFVASGGTCSWYDDRAGNHITVNTCSKGTEQGPRGAADDANLQRQQDKIVKAINGLGADVVSLEELENSVKFGQQRDAAISRLVNALNADAGAGTWAFVPTPANAPDQSTEDVIRTGFIYKAAKVKPVGDSVIDNAPAFDIARDPLAQGFQVEGTSQKFVMIVNHFKSKGSACAGDTGAPLQGNCNAQRVAQAQQLVTFADQMKTTFGTDRVFLAGDFNAYTKEDPLKVLYDAGYADIGETKSPGEYTYQFDGMVGSLDHVLGNAAAMKDVTGAHVWNINSVEPVALEYSRHNYNATNFYAPDQFRSSDHDPLVVGLDLKDPQPVASSVSATVDPTSVVVGQGTSTVSASVTVAGAPGTSGTVSVHDGDTKLGEAPVVNGAASIGLPVFATVGTHTLEVRYSGDASVVPVINGSSTTVAIEVTKPAATATTLTASADWLVIARSPWTVNVKATSASGPVNGPVTVSENGVVIGTGTLVDGVAKISPTPYKKQEWFLGTHNLSVTYAGSDTAASATTTTQVLVFDLFWFFF